MEVIIHRVNTIADLQSTSHKYGVEVDVRANGSDLILNHEPFANGTALFEYLQEFRHKFIVFNIKEAGIEHEVIRLSQQFGINEYFLLDVEFPYLYSASRKGMRKIAIRYSEDECIETVLKYRDRLDYVWIDTNTMLPLSRDICRLLKPFRACLVCPERWGRPEDIGSYQLALKNLGFQIHSVMTSHKYAPFWEALRI
jgi:hypothetical protein